MSAWMCAGLSAILPALWAAGAAAGQEGFVLNEVLQEARYVEHTPEAVMAELEGKKLIGLYFSARWCHPCRIFTPELVRFRDQHKDAFQFVMMSWDKSLEEEQAYLAKDQMNVPAVRFDDPRVKEVGGRFAVHGVPTLLVFDAEGNLVTDEGRVHLTVAVHPSDLKALGNGAGAQAWREMIAANQQEARKARDAELAELVPIVEKYGDFPQLREIFALQGYYAKGREIDRLIARMGGDIAADWERNQELIDEMVVLAAEYRLSRRGDRGVFESGGGACFEVLGQQAGKDPRICLKLIELLDSPYPYARKWALRGLANAAVAGNKDAFQKVADCKSLQLEKAPAEIFSALKAHCDEGNALALELALTVYLKEPEYAKAALPAFLKAGRRGDPQALEAMAALCRSGEGDCGQTARSVLVEAANHGSAHAARLLRQLKHEEAAAPNGSSPGRAAKQPGAIGG